jgi:hypothetical protein
MEEGTGTLTSGSSFMSVTAAAYACVIILEYFSTRCGRQKIAQLGSVCCECCICIGIAASHHDFILLIFIWLLL